MANADRPHGFNPYGPLTRFRPYKATTSSTPAFFIGDVVEANASGWINPASAGDVATLGVSQGYLAVSTAGTVMIADDNEQLFEAQDDASGSPASTDVFANFDHIAGTGSATTLLSGHEIAYSTLSTGDGGFVLLDLVPRADNAWGDNADLVVQGNTGEGVLRLTAGV